MKLKVDYCWFKIQKKFFCKMQNWANFLKCFASNVVSSGNIFDLCFAKKFWIKMSNIHRHLQFSDVAVGHTKKGRIKCLVRGKRLWLSWYSGFFRQLRSTVWIQSLAKFLNWILIQSTVTIEKTKIKKKRPQMAHFFKKMVRSPIKTTQEFIFTLRS